ncbi:MAG: cupin domain-containing protein [Planctomycetes bacterium]|nr:cupin domain-containing protein [Planctomycetota bacterium]
MAKALFRAQDVATANLLEAVPVVAGAIVSKTLVDCGSGKWIVFAMDGGQAISEHHTPFFLTVLVLDGKLDFAVGGKKHTLGPGDWLCAPSNAEHDLVAASPTRFLLTLVRA